MQHLAKQGFNTWHKSTTMWKASRFPISLGNPWQPTTSKFVFYHIKEAFLAREWNSFHFLWKKLDFLHLKDFLKYECELYLKQPLTPSHHNIIDAYDTSNHRLAIQIGLWSSVHVFRDSGSCHFCSYNALENEAHFVLELPLYNHVRDKFYVTIWECRIRGAIVYLLLD